MVTKVTLKHADTKVIAVSPPPSSGRSITVPFIHNIITADHHAQIPTWILVTARPARMNNMVQGAYRATQHGAARDGAAVHGSAVRGTWGDAPILGPSQGGALGRGQGAHGLAAGGGLVL